MVKYTTLFGLICFPPRELCKIVSQDVVQEGMAFAIEDDHDKAVEKLSAFSSLYFEMMRLMPFSSIDMREALNIMLSLVKIASNTRLFAWLRDNEHGDKFDTDISEVAKAFASLDLSSPEKQLVLAPFFDLSLVKSWDPWVGAFKALVAAYTNHMMATAECKVPAIVQPLKAIVDSFHPKAGGDIAEKVKTVVEEASGDKNKKVLHCCNVVYSQCQHTASI